jgi:hypothetical protein
MATKSDSVDATGVAGPHWQIGRIDIHRHIPVGGGVIVVAHNDILKRSNGFGCVESH